MTNENEAPELSPCPSCRGDAKDKRIEELEAKLAKAVDGLHNIIGMLDDPTGHEHVRDMRGATLIARATIVELKGAD